MVSQGWDFVEIWDTKWFPRPNSFKPMMPKKNELSLLRVADLIDRDTGEWRSGMIDHIFLPVDVDIIKSIPLCNSCSCEWIMWHYSTDGNFSVKSAY